MSPGTLTYYFESKDTLLEAALDRYHRRVGRVVRLIGDASAHADMRAVATDLVRYAFANRTDIRLQVSTWVHRWSLPRARLMLVTKTLERAANRPWPSEWSERERRVVIQLCAFGVQHFAALSDDDLTALVGEPDAATAREQVTAVVGRVIEMLTEDHAA